jgi:hypothetical protein
VVKNLEATDLGHGRYSDSAPRLDPIPSPILEQVTVMTEPRAHDESIERDSGATGVAGAAASEFIEAKAASILVTAEDSHSSLGSYRSQSNNKLRNCKGLRRRIPKSCWSQGCRSIMSH